MNARAIQITEEPTSSPHLIRVKSKCNRCNHKHTVVVPRDVDPAKVDWLAGHLDKHNLIK